MYLEEIAKSSFSADKKKAGFLIKLNYAVSSEKYSAHTA